MLCTFVSVMTNAQQNSKKDDTHNGGPVSYLTIRDDDHYWRGLAKEAIEAEKHLLHPDEQKISGFIRFLLKNARQCVKAVRTEGVSA